MAQPHNGRGSVSSPFWAWMGPLLSLSLFFFEKVDGPSPPLTRPTITPKSKQKQSMCYKPLQYIPCRFLSSAPDAEQKQIGSFMDN